MHFNPRSLTGATNIPMLFDRLLYYFNPRSLTGATEQQVRELQQQGISIHAPSRERQSAGSKIESGRRISIHAPSRERRRNQVVSGIGLDDFNPRSLTGATAMDSTLKTLLCYFNPRSLTGATRTYTDLSTRQRNFNPRSLTGATINHRATCVISVFQSTLPHGSDRYQS